MKQPAAYEREPYRRDLPTAVVDTGVEGDRPFALLDDTILYPEGGGQPPDRGFLGRVPVVDVQRRGGEIRAARKVTAKRVTPAEMTALPVRTRGLPEGHAGDVRLVEIAGIDLNTCGGTHLASTGELEALKLLGTEKLRGGTRLSFVAGGRVRRRLGAHEARAAALRVLLGAPDEGLAAAVEAKLGQLSAAEKALRAAEEELAGALARALSAEAGPAVALHLPGRDMAFLTRVGKVFSTLPASSVALLTVDGPAGEAFVLAGGAESTAPVPELGPVVAEALEGRGGGSGKLFQGKGTVSRRDEALRILNERLPR